MTETTGKTRGRPRKRVEIGDNGPTEDDLRIAVAQLLKANETLDEAKAARNRLRKTLKAQGIELGQLDATIKMLEWTPTEVQAHFRIAAFYAQAFNLPAGDLMDLFDHDDKEGEHLSAAKDWFNIGKRDGLAGKGWPDEPPEGCPPENAPDYARGHEDGSEIVRKAWLERQESIALPPAPASSDEDGNEPFGDDESFESEEA